MMMIIIIIMIIMMMIMMSTYLCSRFIGTGHSNSLTKAMDHLQALRPYTRRTSYNWATILLQKILTAPF